MGNNQFYMTGTPSSNVTSAPTWSQRNFYGYTPGGSLVHNFRTGSGAGRGQLTTPLGGTVQQPRTTAFSGVPIPPGSSWVYEANNQYPGSTGLYFGSDQVGSSDANSPPGGGVNPTYVTGNGATLAQSLIIKAN